MIGNRPLYPYWITHTVADRSNLPDSLNLNQNPTNEFFAIQHATGGYLLSGTLARNLDARPIKGQKILKS